MKTCENMGIVSTKIKNILVNRGLKLVGVNKNSFEQGKQNSLSSRER